jgi:hypothetical protein
MPIMNITDAMRYYSADTQGEPESCVIEDILTLMPIPDIAYTGYLVYWRIFLDLNDTDNTENFLTKNYPELIIKGALAEAFDYLQETEEGQKWESKFQEDLRELVKVNNQRALAGELYLTPKPDAKASTKHDRQTKIDTGGYYQ